MRFLGAALAGLLLTAVWPELTEAFTSDPQEVEIITATQALFTEKPVDLNAAKELAERYEELADRAVESKVRRWCLHQLMWNSYVYFWAYTNPSLQLSEKSEDLEGLDSEFLEKTGRYLRAYLNAVDADIHTVGDSVTIIADPPEWGLQVPAGFVLKHVYIKALIDYELGRRKVAAGHRRAVRKMERALRQMEVFIEDRIARSGYTKYEDEQENLFTQAYIRAYMARTVDMLQLANYSKTDEEPAEVYRKAAAASQIYRARLRSMIAIGARLAGQSPRVFSDGLNMERYLQRIGNRDHDGVDEEGASQRLLVAVNYYKAWDMLARPLGGGPEVRNAYLDTVCRFFDKAGWAARRRSPQLDVFLAAAGKLSKGEERRDKRCLFEQAARAFQVDPKEDELKEAFANYADFVWDSAQDLDPQRRNFYARKISTMAPEIAADLEIDWSGEELAAEEVQTSNETSDTSGGSAENIDLEVEEKALGETDEIYSDRWREPKEGE